MVDCEYVDVTNMEDTSSLWYTSSCSSKCRHGSVLHGIAIVDVLYHAAPLVLQYGSDENADRTETGGWISWRVNAINAGSGSVRTMAGKGATSP